MEKGLRDALGELVGKKGKIVVLTGAGISAESGIPTFRGKEGYWTIGSREYRPEEMATYAMFGRNPDEVWQWYLYRIGICRNAEPNAGHLAVSRMEEIFGERFLLMTQNVDGLHLRAGNSLPQTFQIHGSIEFVRCGAECSREVYPISQEAGVKQKDEPLTDRDREALRCPQCGARVRPHVLWFDESYNEEYYHFNSSLQIASQADILLTVGTSGATNLPMQVGHVVAQKGGLIVDVNPDLNPFASMAKQNGGYFCQGPSGTVLPELVDAMDG